MRRRSDQLPGGTHGYSREYVVRHQRTRAFAAVGQAVAVAGYDGASVDDIREISGLSRSTFYDHFADKEDAFAEFYAATTALLLSEVDRAARMPRVRPLRRVTLGVRASLLLAAAEPCTAEAWLTPVGYVSDRLCDLRAEAMAAIAGRISGAVVAAGCDKPGAIGLQVGIGGACEIVRGRLASDQAATLTRLTPELVYWLLAAHVGTAAARRSAFRS